MGTAATTELHLDVQRHATVGTIVRTGDGRNWTRYRLFLLKGKDGAEEPREENPNCMADERNDAQQDEKDYERGEIIHASQAVNATSRSNNA